MKRQQASTGYRLTVLRQAFKHIPAYRVPRLDHETEVDEKARTFSPWSHVVSLGYAQLTHSLSLNDGCDALQLNSGPLLALHGATPPTRNNLSHANTVRDAALAEKLFREEMKYLGDLSPGFVSGKAGKRMLRRMRRKIHAVDSTIIQLMASCMDWAKHRRRKAAANVSHGLNATGDGIFFLSREGEAPNSATFGPQASDFSIGRVPFPPRVPEGARWQCRLPAPTISRRPRPRKAHCT